MVLSDFSPDVGAIADIEAFGVVLARPEGLAQLVTRHRAGVAAHLLPVDRLPAVLVAVGPAHGGHARRCRTHAEAVASRVERLVGYGIDCLLVTPLPDGAGLFWAGKAGHVAVRRHAGGGVRAAGGARGRIAARARAARRSARAAGADRRRSSRCCRSSPAPSTCATSSIDCPRLRDRCCRTTRRRSRSCRRSASTARVYALDGIPRESVPRGVRDPLRARSSTSTFSSRCTTTCWPTRRSAIGRRRRPGLRSALRLPLRFDGRLGGALEFSSSTVATYRETDVDVAPAHRRLRDAGDRAPADGRRGAPRRGAARARRQPADARRSARHPVGRARRARGLRSRLGDRAARCCRTTRWRSRPVLERENRIRVHALSGFTDFPPFFEAPLPEPELLTEPWDYRIIDDLTADPRYAGSPTVKAGHAVGPRPAGALRGPPALRRELLLALDRRHSRATMC